MNQTNLAINEQHGQNVQQMYQAYINQTIRFDLHPLALARNKEEMARYIAAVLDTELECIEWVVLDRKGKQLYHFSSKYGVDILKTSIFVKGKNIYSTIALGGKPMCVQRMSTKIDLYIPVMGELNSPLGLLQISTHALPDDWNNIFATIQCPLVELFQSLRHYT